MTKAIKRQYKAPFMREPMPMENEAVLCASTSEGYPSTPGFDWSEGWE